MSVALSRVTSLPPLSAPQVPPASPALPSWGAMPSVCPVAPPGAQVYADTLTGYVLWGVLALMVVGVTVSIGAIVGGRIFAMPHASKAGVVGIAVVFVAAIAYMVVPGMVAGVTGSGCITTGVPAPL